MRRMLFVAVGLAMVLLLAAPGDSLAQSTRADPYFERAAGVAGAGVWAPGQWGANSFAVANPAEEPCEIVATAALDGRRGGEFGRRLWLPPRARRQSWFPLLIDAKVDDQVGVESRLYLVTEETERIVVGRDGDAASRNIVAVNRRRPLTGLIGGETSSDVREFVLAARAAQNRPLELASLSDGAFPNNPKLLASLDQIVVAGDDVWRDPSAIAALRQWVQAGGCLWMMLDRVSESTPAALLGDAYDCAEVDRTTLSQLQILDKRGLPRSADGAELLLDEPVQFVRLIADRAQVDFEVNTWPAAMWLPMGSGKVLLTTLGPQAWLRDRTAEEQATIDSPLVSLAAATVPLAAISVDAFSLREPRTSPRPALAEYAAQTIGYRVVDRQTVTIMLGAYCGVLAIVGGIAAWYGRVGQLAWIAPSAAIATAGGLLAVGQSARNAATDQTKTAQFVVASANSNDLLIDGELAIYARRPAEGNVASRRGALLEAERPGTLEASRQVWYADNAWEMPAARAPAGLTTCSYSLTTSSLPLSAYATLDSDGVIGAIELAPLRNLGDAVLIGPGGAMAVDIKADGSLRDAGDDPMAEGQYLRGGVLTTDEQRRQNVLRAWLGPVPARMHSRPTLLLWTSAIDSGFEVLSESDINGVALVSLPLTLAKPSLGAEVRIPAALFSYRSVGGPDGTRASSAYSNAEGEWVKPLTQAIDTTLRFTWPKELGPIEVTSAELAIELRAPGREVEIVGWHGDQPRTIASHSDVVGEIVVDIKDQETLQIDQDSSWLVNINVGPHASGDRRDIASAGWSVERVRLMMTGKAR